MINGFKKRPAGDSQPGGAVSGDSYPGAELLVSCPGPDLAGDAADSDQYGRSFSAISTPAIREAATGMGMPAPDILQQIEVPLALPVVISGIKNRHGGSDCQRHPRRLCGCGRTGSLHCAGLCRL